MAQNSQTLYRIRLFSGCTSIFNSFPYLHPPSGVDEVNGKALQLVNAICDEDDESPGDEDNTYVNEVFNNTHYCVTRWIVLQ